MCHAEIRRTEYFILDKHLHRLLLCCVFTQFDLSVLCLFCALLVCFFLFVFLVRQTHGFHRTYLCKSYGKFGSREPKNGWVNEQRTDKKKPNNTYTHAMNVQKKKRGASSQKKRIDHKIWSWFFVEVSCGCVFCCCCSCFWFDLIWLRVKLAATIYENHGKSYFRRKSKQQCNNTSMYTLCKSDMSTVTL